MRHKLYKVASQIIQEQKLSNEIEIDSQYLSINLKGTKLENMPRYSKKKEENNQHIEEYHIIRYVLHVQ